jgi:hypothetical protein
VFHRLSNRDIGDYQKGAAHYFGDFQNEGAVFGEGPNNQTEN